MISATGRPIVLAPVRPSYAIELTYRERLDRLIDEMANSILYWIGAAYKKNSPEMLALADDAALFSSHLPGASKVGYFFALDASPARDLDAVFSRIARRWQRRFDDLAPDLAKWFSQEAAHRSDSVLRASLRKAGFTVRFRTTRAVNDVLQASIAENVSLIRSIPEQYLTQVQGIVMRSVQVGRDLGFLAGELQRQFDVMKRRAAFIARDQSNKATAVVSRVRQQELGIKQARWVHSHAGKEPRPSHLKAGRERIVFDLARGWYDPDEKQFIWPGTLINCRCVGAPIIPGFG